VVNITVPGAKEFFEKETCGGDREPARRAVAAMTATRSSAAQGDDELQMIRPADELDE